MKNLIILVFALALGLAIAFALPSKATKSRNLVVPAGRPEGRITRGEDAAAKQFPYQVGLVTTDTNSTNDMCGGSLLNNEWVLTAAHCVEDIVEVDVHLGDIEREEGEVSHNVTSKKFIVHKDYNDDTFAHDIALIKIPYTNYSENIQPVKLPAIGKSYSDYSGEKVIALGWGILSDSSPAVAEKLQWAKLNIIPNKACTAWNILPTQICTATVGGVNICGGDSGGPLVLESSGIQVGINSYANENCTRRHPAVYTRVTSYLNWIKKHTGISAKITSKRP